MFPIRASRQGISLPDSCGSILRNVSPLPGSRRAGQAIRVPRVVGANGNVSTKPGPFPSELSLWKPLISREDLPPPPPSFLQQTSLPLGDSYTDGTQYTYCNFADNPTTSLYQKYPPVETDQLRVPRYIETQAGTYYGHILDRHSAKTESQCTEDVEDYGEKYHTLTLTNNTSL